MRLPRFDFPPPLLVERVPVRRYDPGKETMRVVSAFRTTRWGTLSRSVIEGVSRALFDRLLRIESPSERRRRSSGCLRALCRLEVDPFPPRSCDKTLSVLRVSPSPCAFRFHLVSRTPSFSPPTHPPGLRRRSLADVCTDATRSLTVVVVVEIGSKMGVVKRAAGGDSSLGRRVGGGKREAPTFLYGTCSAFDGFLHSDRLERIGPDARRLVPTGVNTAC